MREKVRMWKQDLRAQQRIYHTVRRQKRDSADGPTRVVFLAQEPSVWPKCEAVAEAMMNSAAFRVTILCVPHAKLAAMRENRLEFGENNALSDIRARYGDRKDVQILDARTKDGWAPLEDLAPHYLFYQRPYDIYLPEEYRSRNASAVARCCYIPYSFLMLRGFAPLIAAPEFTRNLRLYFVAERYEAEYAKKTLLPTPLRKIRLDGYPLLYQWLTMKKPDETAPFTVLWTPRWTTDTSLGGSSSFFKYWDFFETYAHENPDVRVVVRPHPLAFENFVNSGQTTAQEVAALKARWQALPNGWIDETGDYQNTLAQTDILVTDLSGILFDYAMTERPILYCGEREDAFTPDFDCLFRGFYCVADEDALQERIAALRAGCDEKAAERRAVKDELQKYIVKPPECIVQTVLEDRFGKRRARRMQRDEKR